MALPRIVHLLAALLILLSTNPVLAAPCSVSRDCDDALDCTIDYCEPTRSTCYNMARPSSSNCTVHSFNATALEVEKQKRSLNLTEKLTIIRIAKTLLRDVNAHRKLHTKFLRVDPVRALNKLIRRRVTLSKMTDFDFHLKMVSIFSSLGDLHNEYKLPAPFSSTVALIPITLSDLYDVKGTILQHRYLVGDVALGVTFANPNFTLGVEITSWNGLPISKAISRTIAHFAGSDREATVVRGMRLLTRRFLGTERPPKQSSVTIGFVDALGHSQSVVVPWIYTSIPSKEELHAKDKLSDHIFATMMPTVSGAVQVIRVRDFSPSFFEISDFLAEFRRLMLAPSSKIGVVIDVRGTRAGFNWLAPQFVSTLTSRYILSAQLAIRSTKFMLAAARAVPKIFVRNMVITPPSVDSPIDVSEQIGDQFFGRTVYFADLNNNYTGPRYRGPVIVLTDAETYGPAELFVATARDNDAALVVGVNKATGGGGTGIFSSGDFSSLVPSMVPLVPGGVVMKTAVYRVERSGPYHGVPLEYFGIRPDVRYFMSEGDVVHKDSDLMEFLGRKLVEMPSQFKGSAERQLPSAASPVTDQ